MDKTRRQQALDLRIAAARLASHYANAPTVEIAAPRDEVFYCTRNYLASFTKGLPHNIHSGLLQDPRHYGVLLATLSDATLDRKTSDALSVLNRLRNSPQWHADTTLRAVSLRRVPVRHWDGMHVGNEFQLLGPDAQALTIAAAPSINSPATTAEMAQLYAMALLRDVPLRYCDDSGIDVQSDNSAVGEALQLRSQQARQNLMLLSQRCGLGDANRQTTSTLLDALRAQSLLHAGAPSSGYYLSQFLLRGTADTLALNAASNGVVICGDRRIDQRIRHSMKKDFATTWNEWLDLQHGADLRLLEKLPSAARGNDDLRFIVTPRDLAARVRNTTPLQLFFNTCLMLQTATPDRDHFSALTQSRMLTGLHGDEFASHKLIALLTLAASSAITAARFQQFHVHRRLRPEALAARLEKFDHPDVTTPALSLMHAELVAAGLFDDYGKLPARANRLLPLAWIEGSPMAPSYCSAYAAAAGACATIVKAVFDGDTIIDPGDHGADIALVPSDDGRKLLPARLQQPLTVGAEIDKLAANLAIGRCWAGVSFYSDVAAGLCLGERVAQCLLDEMRLSCGFVTP